MKEAAPAGVKVLVIEDNRADAILVREILNEAQQRRFRLQVATTLREAAERVAEGCDVIVLDLTLPDCRGLETFDRVAKLARKVPIVVLTGIDDNLVEKQLSARGAYDYVRKRHLDGKLLSAILLNATQKH